VTSAGGGVACVDRASLRAVFWAAGACAHSAELLPGNKVVVASSKGKSENRLVLFDLAQPEQPLASEELYGAHGVVWDPQTRILWALGETELHAYAIQALDTVTPALVRKQIHTLPNRWGHDLRPVPQSDALLVTTGDHVWRFDRRRLTFTPCDGLADLANVKAVDIHPKTGRMVFVKAEQSFCSERVFFRDPDGELVLPGQKIYKARWATFPD